MPIYAYKCSVCDTEQDHIIRNADAPPPPCDECGNEYYLTPEGEELPVLERQVATGGSFRLKGTGWFNSGGY